jgi:hypothetical protein
MTARLVVKRARASRSSDQWKDEDYDVLADGTAVGRIYEDASASTPPGLRWMATRQHWPRRRLNFGWRG